MNNRERRQRLTDAAPDSAVDYQARKALKEKNDALLTESIRHLIEDGKNAIINDPRYKQLQLIFSRAVHECLEELHEERRPQPSRVISGYQKKSVLTGYTGFFRKTPVYETQNGEPIYTIQLNTVPLVAEVNEGTIPESFLRKFSPEVFIERYVDGSDFSVSGRVRIVDDYFKMVGLLVSQSGKAEEYGRLWVEARANVDYARSENMKEHYWSEVRRYTELRNMAEVADDELGKQFGKPINKYYQYESWPSITFTTFGEVITIASSCVNNKVTFKVTVRNNTEFISESIEEILDFIILKIPIS